MGWNGPILTDSGGFQVFSLAERAKISEAGVAFRSHLDGRLLELTPERAMSIQEALGADVAMCLDHCPALPASNERIADAVIANDPLGRAVARQAHRRERPGPFRHRPGGSHADLRASAPRP